MILTLVPDVIFSSKIAQVAKELGEECRNAKSIDQFKEGVLVSRPSMIIIDLNAKGLDPFAAVQFLKEYEDTTFGASAARSIGFYSHVDKSAQENAERAGLKEIYPRSEFSRRLADILRGQPQAGVAKITLIVFGAIVAAALYSGFKILPFYYYYFELENQMQQLIKIASTETDKEIRQKLWTHVQWMEIPADKEHLKIEREGNTMRISLPYEEVFYLSLGQKTYDLYTFKFNAFAEGKF